MESKARQIQLLLSNAYAWTACVTSLFWTGTCRNAVGKQRCPHPESCIADIALISVDDLKTPVDSHVLCTLSQLLQTLYEWAQVNRHMHSRHSRHRSGVAAKFQATVCMQCKPLLSCALPLALCWTSPLLLVQAFFKRLQQHTCACFVHVCPSYVPGHQRHKL